MLVLGSILAPSMLHTAFPAFPVVVPPSESRRMISTWHSHNCVFRQLLLTFLNSDVICDESQERWGHFWLLVASIWSVDAKLWTLSRNFPTFTPATSFPFPIDPVKVFCPVRVKNNSGRGAQNLRQRKTLRQEKNEVDQLMLYDILSFHIEHLSYNWSIITYWVLIENFIRVFHEVKHSTIVRSTV